MTLIRNLRRLIGLRLGVMLVLAAFAAPTVSQVQAETLQPSQTLPEVKSGSPGEYFILLLKWSKDVAIGPVKPRVTYLDPPLYLAWMRQTKPDLDQAGFQQQFSGFPKILRFRVGYRAAERSDLHAKDWKVTLAGPDGASIPATEGHRIAPADLKTGTDGDYWEDDWDYQFAVPDGFLANAEQGFTVSLKGPSGEGRAAWTFGTITHVVTRADGYVVYLGSFLTAVCVLLLAGLFITRPPRASVA
jgi:hypothetical protein